MELTTDGAVEPNRTEPKASPRNPLRLAHYYQSLLGTCKFESRAALARFLGVSRARVTQVLNRLIQVTWSANISMPLVEQSGTVAGWR